MSCCKTSLHVHSQPPLSLLAAEAHVLAVTRCQLLLPSLFVCPCQAHVELHPISSHIISHAPASASTHTHTLSLSPSLLCNRTHTRMHTHTHTLLPGLHRANPPLSHLPPLHLPHLLYDCTHISDEKPPQTCR